MKVWQSRFSKHVEYRGKVYECKLGPYYWHERCITRIPFLGSRVSNDMDHLLDNLYRDWRHVRPVTNAEQLVKDFQDDAKDYIRALATTKDLTEDTT